MFLAPSPSLYSKHVSRIDKILRQVLVSNLLKGVFGTIKKKEKKLFKVSR